MLLRDLKALLAAFVGLQGLVYFAANIANWDAAVGVVGYVLSQQEHAYYAAHIVPAIGSPAAAAAALAVILIGEFLVGAVSLKGAWDLVRARRAPAADYNAAKTWALAGAGVAMLVWFGGFIVIGAGLFQMWQTEIGANSMNGAFTYAAISALAALFIAIEDR
jgi:predicted small integral membrane protein